MTIKPLLISAFESALQRYLSLDNELDNRLKPIVGKVIALTILPLKETLYLCPTAESVQIITDYHDQADTHISGSVVALSLMGISATPTSGFFSGDVVIKGDLKTGHHVQQLFKHLNIDLESSLANYTGTTIAHTVSQFLQHSYHWHQETLQTLQLNITEYLQDETQDLPPDAEVSIFNRQVDQLTEDCDRLAAKIQRLNTCITDHD